MLELPDVTLLCVDCAFLKESIPIIERCRALCHFGAVKLLTSEPTDYPYAVKIMPLKDLTVVSVFMLKRVHEFIDTSHLLMIQHDGWILNPDAWDPAWLDYDYIGPVFNQSEMPGVGGFSLRTRRVMARASEISPEWDGTNTDRVQETLGCYEDGILAWGGTHDKLVREGFKFASAEVATRFAMGGNPDPRFYNPSPFGFHRPQHTVNCRTRFIEPELGTFLVIT